MSSGRDLLYKPQTPIVIADDASGAKPPAKDGSRPGAKIRDLGGIPGDAPVAKSPERTTAAEPATKPAYKAAYFNKDISGVRQINQRARNLQALRGAEGVSDLRRVVLPPAIGVSSPDPAHLHGASDLMGLDGTYELNLEAMIGRHSAWSKGQGVTVEMLKARMKRLADMVAARKIALQRMAQRRLKMTTVSTTLEQAIKTAGKARDQIQDVVEAGRTLILNTAKQANAMHIRIAKTLGIKLKQS